MRQRGGSVTSRSAADDMVVSATRSSEMPGLRHIRRLEAERDAEHREQHVDCVGVLVWRMYRRAALASDAPDGAEIRTCTRGH
jgi:hypothetical protein